jgi:hypothetical protein
LWLGGSYSRLFGWGGAVIFDLHPISFSVFYSQYAWGIEPLAGDDEWWKW